MAQPTMGIKVFYMSSQTTPTDWTGADELPDITGIPAMESPPETIDVTTIAETKMMRYINGLMDLGGAWEFPALFTPALKAIVDEAAEDENAWFSVVYPAPANLRISAPASFQPLRPGESAVNEALTSTVYITPKDAIIEEPLVPSVS